MEENDKIDTVIINSYEHKIIREPRPRVDDEIVFAFYDFLNHEIHIEESVAPNVDRTLLLHEILHGILEQSGIKSETKKVERIIDILSHGLISLFRYNKELESYLFTEEKKDTIKKVLLNE